ncbi:MAG: type II toxin-antitoxin system Phd/YefM family antitoxin [Deltaproteobacteria bacterium]|nr:type II toxin-antitoxin system Phd/YefM family antitoxin [Deltaproteobacteria bacterium]MBI3389442.1 type II toxin-antitoxin system Phd/YefM family antitoxin [Deltaproteobacteria bacterium]
MANTWQLQRAKAELSKLIETSATKGPQTVTRHGRPAAVVLSAADYQRLTSRRHDFKAFLRRAPLHQLKLVRSRDAGRRVLL